jgi:anti-sigma factor RsiW
MARKQAISDLLLEQFVLGELSEEKLLMVQQELGRDQELRARLEALRRSDTEIRAAWPAEKVVPAIRERLLRQQADAVPREPDPVAPSRPRPRSVDAHRNLAWIMPIAATVVLVLGFFLLRESILPDQTRMKGLAPHLTVFRKTAGGVEQLGAGSAARRGDVLQLGYAAAGAKYGVIFSVDGRGTVTWHQPAGYAGGPLTAPALEGQGETVLPSAYELDDAPGFERFFLVTAASPFDLAPVAQAARGLAARPSADRDALSLPAGLGQSSLLLKKQG